jgi:hypothetical protein
MIIQNLNNGTLLIKHETSIDPDDEFKLIEDLPKELILFDDFFKYKLKNKLISVQVFEIVNVNTSFADYFSPKKIWEDTLAWEKWFEQFKEQHKMFLYFYDPKYRNKEIFTGSLDADFSLSPTFNESESKTEYFELKDYFTHEIDQTCTFQIHLNTNAIYDCFKKSEIHKCRELLKEFEFDFLNNDLPINSDKVEKKSKM